MAQHQLPLNGLCAERGGGPMVDEEADGNHFLGASTSGTFERESTNISNNYHQRIHLHGHDNSFHGHQQSSPFTSAPPYKSNHLQNQQPAETFSPSLVAGDFGRLATADGPTVRQHLQQQQAAQRQRQQHEAMVRRLCQQQREESVGGWRGGGQSVEKMQNNQPQTNAQRRRLQIESAPPSVTTNMGVHGGGPSPCSFPPSVPSSSSSSSALCGGGSGGELQPQVLMVSAAPPVPPSASKTLSADSLSSPTKRSGRSRAIGPARTKTTATAQAITASASAPGGSSADTIANTIASVASGGGSFEFDKTIGTSPLPASLSVSAGTLPMPPGDSSASLLAPTVGTVGVPSTSAQPQQLIKSPGVKRRRNQQMPQTVTAIVNALEQPPKAVEQQMNPPNQPSLPTTGAHGVDALSHPLQQQTSLGMNGTAQQHEQIAAPSQCRIHVQNLPQTHGDFPPTGTKIQVVHMQPAAVAVSHHLQQPLTENLSPQQQGATVSRPVSSRLSTLRPDHLHSSSSSAPYDFNAANANNNDIAESIHQNGPPSVAELSASAEVTHHSASRVAAAATPYSPYHQQQHVAAAFVSPAPQTQHHYYGGTMPQQLSPSTSYQYNNHNNNNQQQQQQTYPSAAEFKHPSQPSHGHFSPSNNFIIGQNNGRSYRNFPQHYARQQQHMSMDGCSPIPPPNPSPSMAGGDHNFPAQSPVAHPSTSSSPATASMLPGQTQHQHAVLLQHQEGGGVTSPVVTLQCTPPNMVGMYPQQHQFTMPTQQSAHNQQQLQQSQSYHHHQQQMQRYQQQQQQHPLGVGGTTNLAPQPIMVQQQHNLLPPQPSSSHHVQPLAHQHFGAVISPTPPPSAYPSAGVVISSKVPPFLRSSVAPASPFICPAPPPPVVLSQPQPMGSPLPQRAQLSRAQLLSRHCRDVEARKFAVKLYHLQRTIKALVYKNGALADELARLNQRISTVTTERKMLAKRLQHHERNRIRRIQSQYRKAIAAANNNKQQQSNAVEALLDELNGEGRNVSQQKKS